jgi:hypothetical protein
MATNINIDVLKYATDFYTVDTSQYIVTDCNTVTFINYGTSIVTIENVPLQQNQSLSISGNAGEITNQKFFVNFGTSASGNNCVIIRKRYINI